MALLAHLGSLTSILPAIDLNAGLYPFLSLKIPDVSPGSRFERYDFLNRGPDAHPTKAPPMKPPM